MAGDWMKIELELPDKPEVHAMAASLSIDPDAVVGKLIRVWQWFDKHTKDGNAFGVTYSLPDRISGVTGFGEAMMFVGWLEQNDKHLTMPKFDRHTSSSAKTRSLTKVRVEKCRNAPTVTVALPEKRREEKILKSTPLVSSDAGRPDCPHKEIIALYHEHLPELSAVKVWTEKRKAHLSARWREDEKRQSLDYWKRFFVYVSQSDFLMGRKTEWRANLEWLVNGSNFVKVIERNYENKETA